MGSTIDYLKDKARKAGAAWQKAQRAHRGKVRDARRAYIDAVNRVLAAELAEATRRPRAGGRFTAARPITTAGDLFSANERTAP